MTITAQIIPMLPAAVEDGPGIDLAVTNGVLTATLDYSSLPAEEDIGDIPGALLAVQDPETGLVVSVPYVPVAIEAGTGIDVNVASGIVTISLERPARGLLTDNITVYVSPSGNDANSGSIGSPLLTIPEAISRIYSLDFNGFTATIKLANGTYTVGTFVAGPTVGAKYKPIIIEGNTGSPASVILSTTGTDVLQVTGGAIVTLRGVTLQTTTSGSGINCFDHGTVYIDGPVIFGACADYHINCERHSDVLITSDYSISGNAKGHWHGSSQGFIGIFFNTITLVGTRAFSLFFVGTAGGYIQPFDVTFAGSGATGARFLAHYNGIIDTRGSAGGDSLTWLPGSIDGVQTKGGVYGGT